MNEYIGKDLLVKIGQGNNKSFIVLRRYTGNPMIGDSLLQAIDNALNEKYGDARWKTFDYIEVIQEV